jgi:two-component system chemotaxis response regulator CheB
MVLEAGKAVIAPGGMHLRIVEKEGRLYAAVSREPVDTTYHPSIDLLFESAAELLGAAIVGIVLTGMGNDGTQGAQAIRRGGGRVLAESASSCVVYGMPRSVIEAGLANGEAELEKIPALLIETLSS